MQKKGYTEKQVEEIVNQLHVEIAHLKVQLNEVQQSGKDVVLSEVRKIYKELNNEKDLLAEQIISAIDANDYTEFMHLKMARKNIQYAIDELERSYGNDLNLLTAFRGRMSKHAKNSAEFTRNKGEGLLKTVGHGAKWANDNAAGAFVKGLNATNKGVDQGIRLNGKIGRYLVQKTANGLDKLSDALKK